MPRGKILALVVLLAGALAGLWVLYGKGGPSGKADAGLAAGQCGAAKALGERIRPLIGGDLAALAVTEKPFRLPDLTFQGADRQGLRLSQSAGKVRLVNLWATWCVPCREEMPALNRLQTTLGDEAFAVMAINIDQRDEEKPRAWLRDHKIDALTAYFDPSAKVFSELKAVGRAFGLPATMLIDADGCEIAHMAGPADWASERSLALIRALKGTR